MTRDPKPVSREVDLTVLQDEGVLMAANERFFWPFGLALGWDHDPATGQATRLHVREWDYGDGHVENIGLAPDDALADDRRVRFTAWAIERANLIPDQDERMRAAMASLPLSMGTVVPSDVAPEHSTPDAGSV